MEKEKRIEVILFFDDMMKSVLLTDDQIRFLIWLGEHSYIYNELKFEIKDSAPEII